MKLQILIPSGRDPKWKTIQSIDQMRIYIQTKGVNGQRLDSLGFMYDTQCSLLPHGRQRLLDDAISNNFTHAVFIDDDMRFDPDILDSMYSTMLEINNRATNVTEMCAVVGTNALRRGIPDDMHVGTADKMMFTASTLDGFIMSSYKQPVKYTEAGDTGLGFVLMDINLIRKIPKPHFEILWDDKKQDYVGEDRYFIRKLRANGLKIIIDHVASNKLGHIGDFDYCINLMRVD